MELDPATTETYVRQAFDGMLAVAERIGEPLINQRPLGPQTNAIAALIIHCCGTSEYWLGHIALGESSNRARDEEFIRTASLRELRALVAQTVDRVLDHLSRLDAGAGIDEGGRKFLPGGDTSDAAVVLHVFEELYQHLGHIELTADALQA